MMALRVIPLIIGDISMLVFRESMADDVDMGIPREDGVNEDEKDLPSPTWMRTGGTVSRTTDPGHRGEAEIVRPG